MKKRIYFHLFIGKKAGWKCDGNGIRLNEGNDNAAFPELLFTLSKRIKFRRGQGERLIEPANNFAFVTLPDIAIHPAPGWAGLSAAVMKLSIPAKG